MTAGGEYKSVNLSGIVFLHLSVFIGKLFMVNIFLFHILFMYSFCPEFLGLSLVGINLLLCLSNVIMSHHLVMMARKQGI